jgi:3-oxoacyl-[acyl-carrier-protein] synthase II
MRRIVVTGYGVLSPIGKNAEDFSSAIKKGISGAGPITRFDASEYRTKFACEVKDYDPEQYFDRKQSRHMDICTQFAMIAVDEAMKHSGFDVSTVDPVRCGVIWGSGIGGITTLEGEVMKYAEKKGPPRFNPFLIPKLIIDIAPGQMAIKYGLNGINYATVSACSSSSHAIINATDYIKLGKADMIIAGGSEAALTYAGMGGFVSMKALSTRNDDMATGSRPFDRDRDGFVMGEGSAAVILEDLESAKKRGATIYAEILGGSMTADAYHITAPHPDGFGAAKVMELAMQDAGINKNEVDYINVHGTSTPLGDIAEIKAIQNVFGPHAYKLNISSTKSMTGHLLGAAGAVETVASIIGMNEGFVPPTINHFTADPAIDPKMNLTLNNPQQRDFNIVLNNAFGFGGHNTSLVIKKYTDN